ncbi:phosphonate transport system permease protein [Bacillus mesophilus]|uniref:Phosphonate ABC transporter, permease protein PhnE n=1 Tax=Bacillus mesophilus TaxID=1808955 RepID=A0A6M0Q3A0_9BACI|nr:phosphonate ABC transporter, permease protein PhnE [Bacillus mesophilus]MBM7659964.1 phosphonate transport system permease protein [Bacillus mesophilus]NEY70826.1 phosphonate ABC transporter, permease protein PhnE [Bacillus mesophilus]
MTKQPLPQNKKIPLFPRRTKMVTTNILLVIVGFYLFSAYFTEAYPNRVIVGMPIVFSFIVDDLYPPNWGYVNRVLTSLIETWNIALLSASLSAIFALPLSFLAASNINTKKGFYTAVRFFLNILRTIPELILAVILVAFIGIGALAGVVALFIFSLGILAKLISETIEAIDPNPLEAIRATGGNIVQVIWYGVMPQILPHYVSYALYVLEINVRASVVLGFVGAGGIGLILKNQLALFNFGNVSTIVIMTFIAVTIIDFVSNRVRERLV